MMLGDFERAWRETDRSEAQRKSSGCSTRHLPLHERRVWDGAPLEGKTVMVRCYHGLGDTIQFARFLPALRSIARRVNVQAQSSLLPLLQSMPGADTIFRLDALGGNEPEPEFESEIELMELPYALRTSARTLPDKAPYLRVQPNIVQHRREELIARGLSADRVNVGLVWSSGSWNAERNVDFAMLSALDSVPGVRFFSLQRSLAAQQPETSERELKVIPTEHEWGTPLDTAAVILNLDLVISVDTMVAHLAGALGKRVWTMLPFRADWRWMLDREDSPWYPTMRLFRQPRPGTWEPVIKLVRKELRQLARG
jgi:hypothetical protein